MHVNIIMCTSLIQLVLRSRLVMWIQGNLISRWYLKHTVNVFNFLSNHLHLVSPSNLRRYTLGIVWDIKITWIVLSTRKLSVYERTTIIPSTRFSSVIHQLASPSWSGVSIKLYHWAQSLVLALLLMLALVTHDHDSPGISYRSHISKIYKAIVWVRQECTMSFNSRLRRHKVRMML